MNINWDAKGYKENFSFVHEYGEDVISLLKSPKGSAVLDLGCGNGALSAKLLEKGYKVIGMDASESMLEIAKAQYPQMTFLHGDACSFHLEEPVDAIFSNAVLHWIDASMHPHMLCHLAGQLKTGGELVCEFGGNGCAETVHAALERSSLSKSLLFSNYWRICTTLRRSRFSR